MRAVPLIVAGIIAAVVVGALLIDEGEVVTLTTLDESGRPHETQLWIVDLEEREFLRSGSPRSGWLARLRGNPHVVLHRHDRAVEAQATPVDDPELRRAVNEAMAAKYGATDRFYARFFRRDRSVPVLLSPVDGPEGLARARR